MVEVLRRARVALGVSGLLVLAGLVLELGAARSDALLPLVRWFDVSKEANVPTAWSALLLMSAALLAAGLARRERRPLGAWALTALVAAALALDEAVALHERLTGLGQAVSGDLLRFAWVVPGALLAAAVGALLLRAFRDQPRLVRRRLVAAGAVHLTGALLVETASGLVLRAHGDGAAYVLLTTLEEGLELTGACLLLGTLLLVRDAAGSPAGGRP